MKKILFIFLITLVAFCSCDNTPNPKPDPKPQPQPVDVPSITNLNITDAAITLTAEDLDTLTVLISPNSLQDKYRIEWRSSNETVASVSNQGIVRALREGNCFVYATVRDNGKTFSDSCNVKVNKKKYPPTIEFYEWVSGDSDLVFTSIGENSYVVRPVSPSKTIVGKIAFDAIEEIYQICFTYDANKIHGWRYSVASPGQLDIASAYEKPQNGTYVLTYVPQCKFANYTVSFNPAGTSPISFSLQVSVSDRSGNVTMFNLSFSE